MEVCKRKIGRNWNNWLTGYIICMAVVLQMQPAKADTLIKYLGIIHRAFREYSGACLVGL